MSETTLDGTSKKVHPSDLNLYYRNPRVGNVDAIKGSLRAHGQYKPILVNKGTYTDRPNEVLAGNHTLKAIRDLAEEHSDEERWQSVDVWEIDVDDDRASRIVVADNRTSELGGTDDDTLAGLLEEMAQQDAGLEGTGYDFDDLEELLRENSGPGETHNDKDDVPDVPEDYISKVGDVWELGEHRLLCGDSTDVAAVEDMMDGDLVDCIWTDPPYGVNYVGGTGLTIQNDGPEGLEELLGGAFAVVVTVAKPGAPIYVAHADTERVRFETSMRDAGIIVRQNLIWVKNSLVMGRSDYHYKHEPILYGFTPEGEGRLGRGGNRWYGDDSQTTVFTYDKPARNAEHPTMKPIDLIVQMLTNSCPKGGLVLDLFGGSGSTMIAAHHHGARARLVELDPRYADVICRRFQEHTGIKPVLRSTGEEHDFTNR